MINASKVDIAARFVGAASKFIDAKLALGKVSFTLDELTAATHLSVIAARNQLLRLQEKVTRVSPRQPFFLIVPAEHRVNGAPPAAWWLNDYFRWLGRPYYLALQSAASHYGANPQAIQEIQVMTDKPLRMLQIGKIRVRFFVKKSIRRIPTQELSPAYAPLLVSTPEATAYDLVKYANRIGGGERAAETIAPLLPSIRKRELQRVIAIEDNRVMAQTLNNMLEQASADKGSPALSSPNHKARLRP